MWLVAGITCISLQEWEAGARGWGWEHGPQLTHLLWDMLVSGFEADPTPKQFTPGLLHTPQDLQVSPLLEGPLIHSKLDCVLPPTVPLLSSLS